MRRIIALLLPAATLLTLAFGCGGSEPDAVDKKGTEQETSRDSTDSIGQDDMDQSEADTV